MEESKRDILECVRAFFDGKHDCIYIVKSCEWAAILFSENEARRRAELFMDKIGTNDEDIKSYMCVKEKSFFDFAVTIKRIFRENGKIIIRCISIYTFADLFERLQKDMTYA